MRALVTGATGLQGGSVARALRAKGHEVVALTRRPDGEAARSLVHAGVRVVEGDLADAERLRALAADVDAVFGLTNYWEHFEREVEHGRNLVAAAVGRRAHLVLSTLASAERLSGGEVRVPHLETKRAIEDHARGADVAVTFVHVAYYYENFLSWFAPRRDAREIAVFGFPQGETPLAAVSVADVGPVVASVFEEGRPTHGRTVGIVGDELPPAAYAEAMTRATGQPIEYQPVPRGVFARLGFPGAEDLAAMFDFTRRFVSSRAADLEETRRRHPKALSFNAWAMANADALRRVVGPAPR